MNTRRSFIAQVGGIICGAVLGAKLAHDLGAVLPKTAAESEQVLDLTGWTHYDVSPYPCRYDLEGNQWVERFAYQQVGKMLAPNPKYKTADFEGQLWYQTKTTGTEGEMQKLTGKGLAFAYRRNWMVVRVRREVF